jgi:hypothetical protein
MWSKNQRQTMASQKQKWTILHLKQRGDGTWVATQDGVDMRGTGESAPRAARAYCDRLVEGEDGAG